MPAITGTTADLPAGNHGTVAQMRARLKRLSDGKFWDGFSAGNWAAGPVPVDLGPGQGMNVGLNIYPTTWSFTAINIPPRGGKYADQTGNMKWMAAPQVTDPTRQG